MSLETWQNGPHQRRQLGVADRGEQRALDRVDDGLVSTPVEHLTVPPIENLTDRRGDEPQFVEAS
jgi:hypothetical protein